MDETDFGTIAGKLFEEALVSLKFLPYAGYWVGSVVGAKDVFATHLRDLVAKKFFTFHEFGAFHSKMDVRKLNSDVADS